MKVAMSLQLALAASLSLRAEAAPAQIRQGVDARVQFAPILANVESNRTLRYELHLTNFAKEPLTLERVQILDDQGAEVANLSGDALKQVLRPVRMRNERDILTPGRLALLYVDLPLVGHHTPTRLLHRLSLSDGKAAFSIECAGTSVASIGQADLGPPLRGGPWVAVYEPSMDGGHRRVPYAVAGRATIPGRFAIDWFKVDEQGKEISAEGAPVLAVADGVVVATADDFPNPGSGLKPPATDLRSDAGNYIAIDLGGGRYAFYEHLKQGLKVKRGQKCAAAKSSAFWERRVT